MTTDMVHPAQLRGARAYGDPVRVPPGRLRAGLTAPLVAVRRTAGNPALTRVQLAWAAVMVAS